MTKLWVSKCIDMWSIIIAGDINNQANKILVHKNGLHLNFVLVQDLSVSNKLVYFIYYLLNCFNLKFY